MNENPPDVQPNPVSSSVDFVPAEISLNSAAKQYLIQTKPWVRFISILMFIGAGFMVLGSIAMILLGIAGRALPSSDMLRGPAMLTGLGIFYFILAIIYIAPGIFLSRYANAINRLGTTPSSEALELALKNQKSFWRFVGITALIFMILTFVFIVFAVIVGIMAAMRF